MGQKHQHQHCVFRGVLNANLTVANFPRRLNRVFFARTHARTYARHVPPGRLDAVRITTHIRKGCCSTLHYKYFHPCNLPCWPGGVWCVCVHERTHANSARVWRCQIGEIVRA